MKQEALKLWMEKTTLRRVKKLICLSLYLAIAAVWDAGLTQEADGADPLQALNRAIVENETLLDKYPDSEFTANLMFQLVELYVQRARYDHRLAMMGFEEHERLFDAGEISRAPVLPKANFSDAIRMAEQLLKKYPNAAFRDKVMYRLALCHLEEGQKDESIGFLQSLSAESTEKQYLEESYFRLGEYHFERKEYPEAISYYKRLINSWDSAFFDMALYKLGWSYYNVDDYAQAISTLIYLIDDINMVEEVNSEFFGKSNADLRSEATEYVAVCFADYGGPQKARLFFSERLDKDYTKDILLKMAALYRKRNFYDDAIASLNVLLDFYPNLPNGPQIQSGIVENYQLAGEKEKADDARARFVTMYGPGSSWFQGIKDDSLRQNTLAVADEFLYTLATDAQAKAIATKSSLQHGLAINRYQDYLTKFPNSDKSSKVQFYMAESLFEIGRYKDAAKAYDIVVRDYPDSEFCETAAYNRILAYNNLQGANGHYLKARALLTNFLGRNPARTDTVVARNQAQAWFLEASNKFVVDFSNSPKVPGVLMKFGEVLFELEQFGLAKAAYVRVLDNHSDVSYRPQAYTMIAQASFKENNFEESEQWYRKLSEEFPDSTRYVERANKMIASSRFKVAESYLSEGDSTGAAEEFKRVATAVADADVAERALYQAAKLYEDTGKKEQAIQTYENIYSQNPQAEQSDRALFKAAVLREELQQWIPAANNYLTLHREQRTSQFASRSLFAAAKCHENVNDLQGAKAYYDEYVRTYTDDPDRYLEAAFRKAEITYGQNNFAAAEKDFRFVVESYERFRSQAADPEKYLPANAQFLVGEILFSTFMNLKLEPPLERNLKLKKAMFQQVIKAYTDAAKFKIADWATASSFKIGLTLENFANALLDAPRPGDLQESEMAAYNRKLWESVLPFKQKALATYQSNVKQAQENNIQNEWIEQSKSRMQALTIELNLGEGKLGQASGS